MKIMYCNFKLNSESYTTQTGSKFAYESIIEKLLILLQYIVNFFINLYF